MGLLGLVVVLIVGAIVYAVSHRPAAALPSVPGSRAREAAAHDDRSPRRRPLEEDLSRWVDAGLFTGAVGAILDHEQALTADAVESPIPAAVPSGGRRFPIVAEALGYLGGTLAGHRPRPRRRPVLARPTHRGRSSVISAVAALGLLGGGAHGARHADPALARLRWSLWLASTAATAPFAGTVAEAAGAGGTPWCSPAPAPWRSRAGSCGGEGSPRPAADLPRRRGGVHGALVAAFAPARCGRRGGVAGRHGFPPRRPAPTDTGAAAHRRGRCGHRHRRRGDHDRHLAGLRAWCCWW